MSNDENSVAGDLLARIRAAYLRGQGVSSIIRNEPELANTTPIEVMETLMAAFQVGLSDVSCVDGWWPPDAKAEVTDENLDLFISEAIEENRDKWNVEDEERS